mmetsp:Transcript_14914/g.56614  ORF Transcript_14914/g.56614 Transcript_14914/m.56614 type:complete len:92 (-) Transcript_14914:4841-5116(-)
MFRCVADFHLSDSSQNFTREECLKLAKKFVDLANMPASCQSVLANDAKVKKAWEGARPGMAARQAAQYKSRPNHAQLQRRLTSHHARYGNK